MVTTAASSRGGEQARLLSVPTLSRAFDGSGRITSFPKSRGSGRTGSGQGVLEISRVGSGRVGSDRVGSGRVESGQEVL